MGAAVRSDDVRPRVLVVRLSSLGDVVHAMAVLDDIARARPDLAVDWATEPLYVPLVQGSPHVARAIPVAMRHWRRTLTKRATWQAFAACRRALREPHYERVLMLHDLVKGAMIARFARGERHGLDPKHAREPLSAALVDVRHAVDRAHAIDRWRALAAAALGYVLEGPPQWTWRDLPRPPATPAGRYVVACHATSRADKNWPLADWQRVLRALADDGVTSVLPWATPAEEATSRAVAAGVPGACVPPRMELDAVAGLLQRAALVIGVDTGLTHLAAALRRPTLALLVTSTAARNGVGAAGAHAIDLGGNGAAPTVDVVLANARAALSAAKVTPGTQST